MRHLSNRILFLIPILVFVLAGCKKKPSDPLPRLNWPGMYHCHNQSNWTDSLLEETLLGIWEWEYHECYWVPGGNDTLYQGMALHFMRDSTLVVLIDKQPADTATWHVANSWLETEPYISGTFGNIYICHNILLFEFATTDGCNNYFWKVK